MKLVASRGFRHIQLSAALPTMKPRDLDRSARRDLLARLRRNGLTPSGLDLWIPEEHFTDDQHMDRAAAAVGEAIGLAADLARIPVSVRFPAEIDEELLAAMRQRSDTCGVTIADHARSPANGCGRGIDPASLLLEPPSVDPVLETAKAMTGTSFLASARLSDAGREGRVEPGTGRLDLMAYQVALVTGSFTHPVILDLRHISDPADAMMRAASRWNPVPA